MIIENIPGNSHITEEIKQQHHLIKKNTPLNKIMHNKIN